jgi:hypothetical protein
MQNSLARAAGRDGVRRNNSENMLLLGCIVRQPDPGPIVWLGLIPLGILLVLYALRSKPIRSISGIIPKLRALASNYWQGPDQKGRDFFTGLMCIVFGVSWLLFCR